MFRLTLAYVCAVISAFSVYVILWSIFGQWPAMAASCFLGPYSLGRSSLIDGANFCFHSIVELERDSLCEM